MALWQKGQSGNPAGPPNGNRHKTSILAEKLMASHAEQIVEAVVTAARNGDMAAAKIILDRLVPVRRSNSFELPKVECSADRPAARAAALAAVANGYLTMGEAEILFSLIDKVARSQIFDHLDAPLPGYDRPAVNGTRVDQLQTVA